MLYKLTLKGRVNLPQSQYLDCAERLRNYPESKHFDYAASCISSLLFAPLSHEN